MMTTDDILAINLVRRRFKNLFRPISGSGSSGPAG